MSQIEFGALGRPYPEKNHDRMLIDGERNIFAIFDGAGCALASTVALSSLRQFIDGGQDFDAEFALNQVHSDIYSRYGGKYFTTGLLANISNDDERPVLSYASAGDSRLYIYDHQAKSLSRATTDEVIQKRNNIYIENNFLGHYLHDLRQVGKVLIERETTFALLSDGVTDKSHRGHLSDRKLRKMFARDESPQITAESIINNTPRFDDASAVIIRVHGG